jgi:uncharacterized protein (TIGR02246 family)
MTPLDELLARDACRTLVLDAAAAVDARQPDAFAALFAEDGVLVRPGGEPLRGRDAIRDAYARRPATRITHHLVSNQRVTLAPDGTTAQVHSMVVLWSGDETDATGPQGRRANGPQVVGEFHDSMRLTGEGWRIAERRAGFLLHGSAA